MHYHIFNNLKSTLQLIWPKCLELWYTNIAILSVSRSTKYGDAARPQDAGDILSTTTTLLFSIKWKCAEHVTIAGIKWQYNIRTIELYALNIKQLNVPKNSTNWVQLLRYTDMNCLWDTYKVHTECIYYNTIVRSFEICRASQVTENWTYPCAKIIAVMDLILSVFLLRTTMNIH